jgi:hypothetical protein
MQTLALAGSVAALLLSSAPDELKCLQIRAVRQLANVEQLDERSFVALERRYCPALPPSAAAPPQDDCTDLEVMATLARIVERPPDFLSTVDAYVSTSCALNAPTQRPLEWPNRTTARSSSRGWYYPNGQTARNSSGAWSYPTGRTARTSSGVWYYPDGRTARNSSGTWLAPSGRTGSPTQLLAETCARSAISCDPWLGHMRGLYGDAADAAVVAVLWTMRQGS